MAFRSIETNRRQDQVRSNAYYTLEVGWFVEVLLIDLLLALRCPKFLQDGFRSSHNRCLAVARVKILTRQDGSQNQLTLSYLKQPRGRTCDHN